MILSVLGKIDFASYAVDDVPYVIEDGARQVTDSLVNTSGESFAGLLVIK